MNAPKPNWLRRDWQVHEVSE